LPYINIIKEYSYEEYRSSIMLFLYQYYFKQSDKL